MTVEPLDTDSMRGAMAVLLEELRKKNAPTVVIAWTTKDRQLNWRWMGWGTDAQGLLNYVNHNINKYLDLD